MSDKDLDKVLLQKAQKYICIQDVYMHNASIEVQDGFIPKYNETPLSVQFHHSPLRINEIQATEDEFEGELLQIFIKMAARFIDTGLDDEILSDEMKMVEHVRAEIESIFIAEYIVTNTEECTKECIKVFGRTNASFHVWPYWREYMQATCARFKLPNFVFPMYRIHDEQPMKETSSKAEAS